MAAVEELDEQEVAAIENPVDDRQPEDTRNPPDDRAQTEESPAADLPEHVREHYEAIREKEREVRGLESNYFAAKEEAGIAKKEFELADKALRDMIARGSDPQLKLPLTDAPAPEAWRTAPFSELGLTAKQNELFESAGVTTIGGVEDLRAQIAEGKAEWPKGIGPAKVTDIENRIVDWLDKNRDKFGEPATVRCADGTTFVGTGEEVASFIVDKVREDFAADCEGDGLVPIHKPKSKAKHKSNGKAKTKKKSRR
jgi:hypothetical protein